MTTKSKYLSREEATSRLPNGGGRRVGSKNKATIFKEVIREGFEKRLEKDGMKVVQAVIDKAIDGDMQAAKLLLDRILPTTKAIDLDQLENSKGLSVSINIGNLDTPSYIVEGEKVKDNDKD